jgi:type IV pilus assembly protein PilC
MRFEYQARTVDGKVQTGTVEASSRDGAFNVLKTHGLYVTSLEEIFDTPFYAKKLAFFSKAGKRDVVIFSRQVSIMFKANVPITETFRTIAKQTKKADFKDKIFRIAEAIEGGIPLSRAFSVYPNLFTTFYINMVKAGEASGKLSEVFLYLADYLEKQQAFQSKITGAMIYPAFVVVVFIAVVGIIMGYVIPQLAEVLTSSGAELPLLTKIVIAISDFVKEKWWLLIIIFAILIFILVKFYKSKQGKDFFDQMFLKIPIVSTFFKKLYLARFAMNLSTLIAGGLPITAALEISGEVVGNNIFREVIFETRDRVKRGETISSSLERYPDLVSPLFYQMVMVGEKTGTLDSSLESVVAFYQDDVDRALDSFTRLLEPIFMILLGGVVALLMGAVLMPLYSGGMIGGQ